MSGYDALNNPASYRRKHHSNSLSHYTLLIAARQGEPGGTIGCHFYNPTRRHQHLPGVSPEQFEAAAKP